MLHLVNALCKASTGLETKTEFEAFLLKQNPIKAHPDDLVKSLFAFKHSQTGDTVLNFAARCGNVELIRMLCENYGDLCPKNFLDYSNNDGKSALHEVNAVQLNEAAPRFELMNCCCKH